MEESVLRRELTVQGRRWGPLRRAAGHCSAPLCSAPRHPPYGIAVRTTGSRCVQRDRGAYNGIAVRTTGSRLGTRGLRWV